MVEIRKATYGDLATLHSFDIFAGDRAQEIERGECFVAVLPEGLAGYVVFNHSFYLKPFIQFLCVASPFRRQGIANRLLAHIEELCDGEKLFTSTESDNLPMLRLLNRRGYRVSGVIENIQTQSEVVFCKTLKTQSLL
ncbi:MAG: GNAT family N-acetyltransferase [Thermostichus sp. BF3_bins_97]